MKNNTKKHIIISAILVCLAVIPHTAKAATALNNTKIYKGIVQIFTYYEDSDYMLRAISSGSGAIIDEDGTILTNHHVVTVEDGFDDELPVAFKICLTTDTTQKPDCHYSADLITKDEDKDIALLKIKNIGLVDETKFDYINRAYGNIFRDGDYVQALGYPSSGGETITGTMGTISGTTEKYSLSWIKTSALVSFGSSGGALIDLNGNLLGVTSAVIGDVGYAININSINTWINNNSDKTPTVSTLQERMNKFIIKQNDLKTENKFVNTTPHIEATRSVSWEFTHLNESAIAITNPKNAKGGFLSLVWSPTDNLVEPVMDVTIKVLEKLGSNFSAGTQTISGKTGRKLITPISGEGEIQKVLISSKNYIITVSYYYGEDNVDKIVIDEMIGAIKITDGNNDFAIRKEYEHQDPYFKISLDNGWSLRQRNSRTDPVGGQKVSIPESAYDIEIKKLTKTMESMTKEEYFNFIKDEEAIKYNIESRFGYKADRYLLSTDYKINEELNSEIFYKYRFKDEDDGDKIKYFAAGYRIIKNDKVMVIGFFYVSESEEDFESALKDFESSVLANLTFKKIAKTQITSKNLTSNLGKKLIGKIVLQVESKGEAWYLCPDTNKAHFLGRPADAFNVMRELGLGISEATYNSFNGYAPSRLAGKILLRVEAKGEAYYVDPKDNKLHFLGRPADAFQVMRNLGLGISDNDFEKI